jgi:hypothetical protein
MLGPSGIGLDDIVSSRIGLAAATPCLAIGTGEGDVRSGASRRRRWIRDDDAHRSPPRHSSACWPACRRSRAACSKQLQLSVVVGGPDVIDPDTTRPRLRTICTAVAPEAVFTRRTNEPTDGTTRRPASA